ncbi:HAD-IA family hydrolase [Actinospongicola halichondriae]|uniref:HAD-IA family hydrolase n=1 Tax=Actinospongicola halichondriae TaxID=3236844 RepID=UPI003D3CA731
MAEGRDSWRPMLPLDEIFDDVVDSSEVGMRKPNPLIYRLALDRLGGVAPERAIMLDDFPGNCGGARGVGMEAILVEDPEVAVEELRAMLGR